MYLGIKKVNRKGNAEADASEHNIILVANRVNGNRCDHGDDKVPGITVSLCTRISSF